MPRRKVDAAAVAFALLVLATLAAFAYAQRVKRDPLLVDRTEIGAKKSNAFFPEGPCDRRQIRLKFRTTTSNDGTVEVIRPGGESVRVLAADVFLKRYSYHVFHWDGRAPAGRPAPPGRYRLRVLLDGEDRSLVLPGTIRLQKSPPPRRLGYVTCTRGVPDPAARAGAGGVRATGLGEGRSG